MEIMKSKIAQHYSCKLLTDTVVLPSLGQSLGKEDEDFFSLELLVTGDAAAEVETVEEFIGDAT